MDANHRDYINHAADAAKRTTRFLKTFGVEQAAIAKHLDISFSYLSRMLCGERPFLPKHLVGLQQLTLKTIAERNGVLTREQYGLMLDLCEAMLDATIAWNRDTVRNEHDRGAIDLLQTRNRQLNKLGGEAFDRAVMSHRLNEQFPETLERQTLS